MDPLPLEQVHPGRSSRRWTAAFAMVALVVVAVGGFGLLTRGDDNQDVGPGPVATSVASPATSMPSSAKPVRTPLVGDHACTVTTVAGKAGSPGHADGTGAAARFSGQSAPMFIRDDVLFIVDRGNGTLRSMTMDGTVTTWAGKVGQLGSVDGPADTTARFREPNFMALGPEGAIYVADHGDHVIRKITDAGNFANVTTLAGKAGEAGHVDGPGSIARFNEPFTLAVDTAGNVYVGEVNGHTIRKITPDGTVSTLAGKATEYRYGVDGPASEAGFGWPFWLGFDAQGVLHVIDLGEDDASLLRTVSADGTVTTVEVDWQWVGPPAMVWYDPSGAAYVISYLGNTVSKLAPDGTVTLLAGRRGASGSADGNGAVAKFQWLMGIVGDGSGTLYVGDTGNATIRSVRCP